MRISSELRRIFSEKVLELANLGVGALLFSQLLSEENFSWPLAIGGVLLLVASYLAIYVFHEGGVER